jgi:hypothetical protein
VIEFWNGIPQHPSNIVTYCSIRCYGASPSRRPRGRTRGRGHRPRTGPALRGRARPRTASLRTRCSPWAAEPGLSAWDHLARTRETPVRRGVAAPRTMSAGICDPALAGGVSVLAGLYLR